MELLLGSGHRNNTGKEMSLTSKFEWNNCIRLDNRQNSNPDVLWDLNQHPLPFEDNKFDEIHAYHVLEHIGKLGDYKFFYAEWSEYWRILKHGGIFYGKVPANDLGKLFGEPSHTRVIVKECFGFLSQKTYEKEIGETRLADYRDIYKADFTLIYVHETAQEMRFALRAEKK